MTTRSEVRLYRFGPYELDLNRDELRKFGVRVKLERKPFQLLVALLLRAGEVVTYTELQKSLWGENLFVNFSKGLTVAVTKVRAALSDSVANPAYIETVSGAGYRFIACIEEVAESTNDSGIFRNQRDDSTLNGSKAQRVLEKSSSTLNGHPSIKTPPSAGFSRIRFQTVGGGQRSLSVAVTTVIVLIVGFMVFKSTRAFFLPRVHSRPIAAQVRRYVFAADYGENSIRSYLVNPANGSLEAAFKPAFRAGEHPYLAVLSSNRDFLYVANRGRADGACGSGCNISGYAVDPATGAS